MRSRCKVTKIDPKFAKSWAVDWLASLSSSQRVTKTTANQQIHGAAYHWRRLFFAGVCRRELKFRGNSTFRAGVKQIVLESTAALVIEFCAVIVEVYHGRSSGFSSLC